MARCEECGFDWTSSPEEVVAEIAVVGRRFETSLTRLLEGEDQVTLVRTRPEPDVWSALEYAAHMRDVIGFYRNRIERVVAEDSPQLEAVGFARLADERRYLDDDPAEVLRDLAHGGSSTSALLTRLTSEQWERVGIGSEGGERTVLVLGRRLAHECHHHLLDLGRVLRRVREGATRAANGSGGEDGT